MSRTKSDRSKALPALRDYASEVIARRLEKTLTFLEGVRSGSEVEAIHQMRVWSRRSRAALSLFHPCFPSKTYLQIEREVKRITGALGEARDLDVMLLNLRQRAETLPESERAGIESLLERLQARRAERQQNVEAAAKRLAQADIVAQFTQLAAEPTPPKSKRAPIPKDSAGVAPNASLLTNAARTIETRLDEFLGYERYVRLPECVLELHELRIAAKRLRYTMEIFQPVYAAYTAGATEFDAILQEVRGIQEHLGEIHDADVLVPQLTEQLARFVGDGYGKDAQGEPLVGVHRVDFAGAQGLLTLCRQAQGEREARYIQFLTDWERLQQAETWSQLRTLLFTISEAHRVRKPITIEIEKDDEQLDQADARRLAPPDAALHRGDTGARSHPGAGAA